MAVNPLRIIQLNIEEAARPSQDAWTLERNHDYWMRAITTLPERDQFYCYKLAGVWWREIVKRFGPSKDTPNTVNVICKTGPTDYKKHSLVRGDNTAIVVEQLMAANVSVDFYRVTFKPTVILPDIDIRGPGLDQEMKNRK